MDPKPGILADNGNFPIIEYLTLAMLLTLYMYLDLYMGIFRASDENGKGYSWNFLLVIENNELNRFSRLRRKTCTILIYVRIKRIPRI